MRKFEQLEFSELLMLCVGFTKYIEKLEPGIYRYKADMLMKELKEELELR